MGGGDQPPFATDSFFSAAAEAGDRAGVFGVREDRFDHCRASSVEALAGKGLEDLVDPVGLGALARRALAVLVVRIAGRDHHNGVLARGRDVIVVPVAAVGEQALDLLLVADLIEVLPCLGEHRRELVAVVGACGDVGGDDQPALPDQRLGVEGLDERAARVHDPAVGVGDVALGIARRFGAGPVAGWAPTRVAAGALAVFGAAREHRLVLARKRGLLGLDLALGALQPRPARDRIGQLARQLVAARVAKLLVLGGVDLVGLGQDPLDLLADLLVGPVGRQARVGGDLGAVHGDRPDPHHPGLGAHRQDLHEQPGKPRRVALAKPVDRGVVRRPVGRDHPKRHVLLAAPLDLPRGALPDHVRVKQQRDHHPRIVRRPTAAVPAVLTVERGQIKLLDDIKQIPGQMPRRQPLTHTGRHQEVLIAITGQEALCHHRTLVNRSDGPGGLTQQPQTDTYPTQFAAPALGRSRARSGHR